MALLITRCILFYNKMMKDLEGSQLAFPYKANPYKFFSRVFVYIQIILYLYVCRFANVFSWYIFSHFLSK